VFPQSVPFSLYTTPVFFKRLAKEKAPPDFSGGAAEETTA
jgi:hypothetical protein